MKLALALICLSGILGAAAGDESTLIRNVTVHTVSGPVIPNSSVLITAERIAQVGPGATEIAGARVIDGTGLHLYPGLINAATNVGLAEIEAVRETQDTDEIGPFNPELRSHIAFNPSSEHIPVTRAAGITSVLVLPSDSRPRRIAQDTPIITGQGSLMHLDGWTWEDMSVQTGAVMDMFFPQIRASAPSFFGASQGGAQGRTFAEDEKVWRERLAALTDFLEQARRYSKAKRAARPDFRRDLRLEAMLPVVDGKQPLLIHAERERLIKEAVAFADREKVKIVIASPEEIGSTGDLLKSHNIPVVLGKALALPLHDDDPYDEPYTLPDRFYRAGVKICFGTYDVQFARNVGFEAAQAAAFGLPPEEALKAVTLNAAQILGVGDRLGSIEQGKLADLILTDGDPLEARTSIRQMWINGREVSLESRHTREYEKWKARPQKSPAQAQKPTATS